MGRGLSGLQQTMLRLGLEAHEADGATSEDRRLAHRQGRVYYSEVLVEHWALPEPQGLQEAKKEIADPGPARRAWARRNRGRFYIKWQDYTDADRGSPLERLYTPRVALTRAARRLEARGLIRVSCPEVNFEDRGRVWFKLTEAGIEQAQQSMARADNKK